MTLRFVWALSVLALSACASSEDPCHGPPGLYADAQCRVVNAEAKAYVPQYGLWADGLEKERYVILPEGAKISTGAIPITGCFP
ncbi:MAG: hypothetical protein QM784_33160 [Polyangiaceae bacterium]